MTDTPQSESELIKHRRISFSGLSMAEVGHVVDILKDLAHVEALPGADGSSVEVTYSVAEHTLAELENVLTAQGYRLESGLLERVRLGLIHFTEEIQYGNAHDPLRGVTRDGRLRAIYANAEKHTHDKHPDDGATPQNEAWRTYF